MRMVEMEQGAVVTIIVVDKVLAALDSVALVVDGGGCRTR